MMASLAFPDRRRLLLTVNLSDIIEISKENISTQPLVPSSKMLELSRPVSTSTSGLGGDGFDQRSRIGIYRNCRFNWEIIQRVPDVKQQSSLVIGKS